MSIKATLTLPLGDIVYQSSKQHTQEELQRLYIHDTLQAYSVDSPDIEGVSLSSGELRIYNMLRYTGLRRTVFFETNFTPQFDEGHASFIPHKAKDLTPSTYEMTITPEGTIGLWRNGAIVCSGEIAMLASVFNYMTY